MGQTRRAPHAACPMSPHVVRLDAITARPWKNGGGHTRELLAWPQADAWSLRLSVAEIARDGPFSAFPGIERWFAVVDGPGVVLALAAGAQRVERGAAPLRFDGAQAPACTLLGGPSTDLNLMVRRDAGSAALHAATPDAEWLTRAPWRGLYAADAVTLQIDDAGMSTVAAGTLVWSSAGARQRWRMRPVHAPAPRAWWIEFEPRVNP